MSAAGEPLTREELALVAEGQPEVEAALRRFARSFTGIPRDEQRSIAQLALVEAARSYDASRGRLGVYLRFKIDFALLEARRERFRHERLSLAVMAASRRFLADASDPTSPAEGTEEAYRHVAVRLLEAHAATMLLGYAEDRYAEQSDAVMAEQLDSARARAVVAEVATKLPERQRAVLQRHYRDGLDLSALAAELSVSRATITRDNASLVETLRSSVQRARPTTGARAE